MGDNPPPTEKTMNEIFFEIMDTLCKRYKGTTPFIVLNTPTSEVFEVWTDMILFDRNNNEEREDTKTGKITKVEWVTSKTASWH